MLCAGIDFEFAVKSTTQPVVGNHAADGTLDKKLRATLTTCTECLGLVTTDEAGKTHVGFGDFLFATDGNFGGIDNDDEVARVDMWREDGFVFTAKKIGGLDGDAAERLTGGINEPPLALHLFGFGRIGFHL